MLSSPSSSSSSLFVKSLLFPSSIALWIPISSRYTISVLLDPHCLMPEYHNAFVNNFSNSMISQPPFHLISYRTIRCSSLKICIYYVWNTLIQFNIHLLRTYHVQTFTMREARMNKIREQNMYTQMTTVLGTTESWRNRIKTQFYANPEMVGFNSHWVHLERYNWGGGIWRQLQSKEYIFWMIEIGRRIEGEKNVS